MFKNTFISGKTYKQKKSAYMTPRTKLILLKLSDNR